MISTPDKRITRSRTRANTISPTGSDRVLRSRRAMTPQVETVSSGRRGHATNNKRLITETAHDKENKLSRNGDDGYSHLKTPSKRLKLYHMDDNQDLKTPTKSTKKQTIKTPKTPRTPSALLQEAKNMFRRCATSEIVGRDEERQIIQTFWDNHVSKNKGGSLYISGYPGTGKTALVDEICQQKIASSNNQIKLVKLNCMRAEDPKKIFSLLLKEIKPNTNESLNPKQAKETLESIFVQSSPNRKSKLIVVVLDEIDHLYTKDQEILYVLFEWPKLTNSRLVLIGIANALDLIDRILPRLKTRLCEPQILNFNPYDIPQITEIIKQRVQNLEAEILKEHKGKMTPSKSLPLIQSSAIEFCARKVVGTGDLRKALDVCRKAIERLEMDQLKFKSNLSSSSSTLNTTESGKEEEKLVETFDELPKVTVQHIVKVTTNAMGSAMSRKVQNLPVHHQLVLCTIVFWQNKNKGEMNYAQLQEKYYAICNDGKNTVGRVTRSEFNDIISILEMQGLLTIGNAKDERYRKIQMNARKEDIEVGVSGNPILERIIRSA